MDRKKFSKVDHLKENDSIVKNISDFLYSKVSEKAYSPEKKLKLITGLYCPMLGEPNLLNLAVNSKWSVAIPKIRGEGMDFVKYEVGSPFETIMSGKLKQPDNNIKLVPHIAIFQGWHLAYLVTDLGLGLNIMTNILPK